MSSPPIEGILEIVRDADDATQGWERLRSLLSKREPSRLWDRFEDIDPTGDVESARSWLDLQLRPSRRRKPVRGVYLGLDTWAEDDRGSNVEMATSTTCNLDSNDLDWIFACDREAGVHLLNGLVKMKRVYAQRKWARLRDLAEYSLYLGYSGVVLAEAFKAFSPLGSFLVAWGFYDGDMFPLGRRAGQEFTRLAISSLEDHPRDDRAPEDLVLRLWPGPD